MDYKKYAKLRDERGYTDYQVAKETGILTSTLSSWKVGRYTPKLQKIMLIANLFGVSIEEFL